MLSSRVVARSFWVQVARAVARRPPLWATAARQCLVLARPGWGRRPPFLPVPDPEYVRFRWETQYGSDGEARPEDVIAYLEWCREMRR